MKSVAIGFGLMLVLPVFALAGASHAAVGPAELPTGDLGAQVSANPRIALSVAARSDIESGVADPRILAALFVLAEDHTLDRVGPIRTGHSYFVNGTNRVSNHVFGRAVDISAVDGAPVSARNVGALELTKLLLSLPDAIRPDEVGSPWRMPVAGSFTDAHHRDHIHLGWSR
jgi:hypothetical protein